MTDFDANAQAIPQSASLVVLISGAGSNLLALLEASQDVNFGARIVHIIADADVPGLDHARTYGVPYSVVRPRDYPDRDAWNVALRECIEAQNPSYVVCAGFMRILGPEVVNAFQARIVNTHPALLPSFPGAHGVRDALAHGVKFTGATVHLVDVGVDTGPILAQTVVPIEDCDSEDELHERIKVSERQLLVNTISRLVNCGVSITGRTARLGTIAKLAQGVTSLQLP